MEALINMLRDTEPDVAGFSEVRDQAGADQWTALTEHAWIAEHYASVYSQSDPLQSGGSGEEERKKNAEALAGQSRLYPLLPAQDGLCCSA